MVIPLKGCLAIFGGFIIHFTLGTVYTFGNMNPYLTSYMKFYSKSPEINYPQSTWIFSLSLAGQGFSMALGGLIETRIGARFTALFGSWFMSLGVILSSLTVKSYFVLISLTYGVMFGVGTGVAYSVAIAAAMKWFPSRKGLVGGIVAAGFGGGSLVFNQLQTFYINPDNVKANYTLDGDNYFDQPEILDRVPSCFIVLGSTYAAMQLLGALLLFPVPPVGHSPDDQQQPLILPQSSEEHQHSRQSQEQQQLQLSPRQLVKKPIFWILWLTFLVNAQSLVYISSQYKAYGLYRQFDDHFLAITGSVSSVFNSGTRVVWGLGHDLLGYWRPMLALCTGAAVLLATFYLSSSAAFYFIYVCLMFAFFAGNFALFPAACAKLFGSKFFSVNYGLIFTGNAISAILGAILTSAIKEAFGWLALFITGASFSAAGVVLTLIFLALTRARSVQQEAYNRLEDS
uniref:MFS domain-containing protein n=2 Tax=Macrostomum lignano TaxID=282301 RepID=A0A1I8HNT4_9PLAT